MRARSARTEPHATLLDPALLFPGDVLTCASAIDAELSAVPPEERMLAARAVPARQRELATGRRNARRLLARLGVPAAALAADADRVPLWPAGAVGSISHTRELCVVAVAAAERYASLGVDVEDAARVQPELWEQVLVDEERAFIERQASSERVGFAAIVFSAKEAAYKARFPLDRTRRGFKEACVAIDASRGLVRVRYPGVAAPLEGRFVLHGPWVATGIALAPEATR